MEIKDVIGSFEEAGGDCTTKEKVYSLLGRLGEYHESTLEHSLRIGLLSRDLGSMQNREPKAGLYGALHDIGKISIPKSLLDKCEGFDEEDRKVMKGHVVEGYKILVDYGLPFSAWIALTHQDRKSVV